MKKLLLFLALAATASAQNVLVTNDADHPVPVTFEGTVEGGGDASAANQTAVQANAGSDATKATAVQGITGGKAVPVSGTVTANAGTGTQAVSMAAVPTGASTNAGAPNAANSQVATSTTAGTLAIARATRRFCVIKNMDAAITVYVGVATVTAGNGFPLTAGQSMNYYGVGLIQAIAASGTPTVAIIDYYD